MAAARKPDLKEEALKERGALNLHPERITDKLFANNDFFDPHDLVQVKYEMLRRAQKEGWSVTKAARTFGFSRVAFYQALAAFKRTGLSGLLRQRTGPKHPHKLTDQVLGFVREVLGHDPALSTAKLPWMIEKRFGISIHRRSLERALNRTEKKG